MRCRPPTVPQSTVFTALVQRRIAALAGRC
jgi:hypothetical protein